MDLYRDSFFLQNGSLDSVGRSVLHEFEDGSILFVLSGNPEFLNRCSSLIQSSVLPGGLDECLNIILADSEHDFSDQSLFFLYLNPNERYLECITQNMPPLLLKKKNDEISLIEQNFTLRNAADSDKAVIRMPLDEVAIMVLVNDVRIMTELKTAPLSFLPNANLKRLSDLSATVMPS